MVDRNNNCLSSPAKSRMMELKSVIFSMVEVKCIKTNTKISKIKLVDQNPNGGTQDRVQLTDSLHNLEHQ